MPTIPGGQKRLLFTGNVRTNLVNKYTPGTGVGALSTSTRRALKRRATAGRGTLDGNGNLIPSIPKPCCSAELTARHETLFEEYFEHPYSGSVNGNVIDAYVTGTLSLTTDSDIILKNDIEIDENGGFTIDITEYTSDYDVLILKTNNEILYK